MTRSVVAFDVCSDIDQRAAQANHAHEQIVRAERGTALLANRAGAALRAVQEGLPHGEWLRWLKTKCPTISPRRAQEYLDIHERWTQLPDTRSAADLSIREVQRILGPKRKVKRSTVLRGQGSLFEDLPVIERRLRPIPREETPEYKTLVNRADRIFKTNGNKAEAVYAVLSSHPLLVNSATLVNTPVGRDWTGPRVFGSL